MSNIPNTAHVPNATEHSNVFDLSCDHYTTTDFFKRTPVYISELVPKSSISVNPSLMARLSPMFQPMYANCKFVFRAFFVPFRVIFPDFNAFIEDSANNLLHVPTTVPLIKNSDIVSCLTNPLYSDESDSSGSAYDFKYRRGSTLYNYRFTARGKYLYTILLSLGYSINFHAGDTTQMSAMPLLAYAKLFDDWYQSGQYRNFDISGIIETYMHGGTISSTNIATLFENASKSYYYQDYFTQAWDNPTSPNQGPLSTVVIEDPTVRYQNQRSRVSSVSGNSDMYTPFVNNADGSSALNSFTQFGLDALKALTDYMKRKQLAGSKIIDRYLAQWGVKLESEKLNRSVYLGSREATVQIADIMCTNNDIDATLGEYAGRGICRMDNGKPFSYKSDEFGYIIVTCECMPRTPIVQGRKRHVFHGVDGRLSFYNGEFDGLGCQAIRKDEVFAQVESAGSSLPFQPNEIFGFVPRYAEYKTSCGDYMSGDFSIRDIQGGLSTYHLCRLFGQSSNPVHSSSFIESQNDSQFSRVWNVQDVRLDHFICVMHFDVKARQPMSQVYDNYHFEEDGSDSTIQVNGTQLGV